MNAVAQQLTGWRTERARGTACDEVFKIINEESRRPVASPVTRVLAEGTVVGLANHTLLIAADGVERPIDDSGAPIRSQDGRVIGVVLVFRDVSERRRAETERHIAGMEREQLLEAERAARAAAERADRAKDEFLAMVSHELRTPLNAILGWTYLLMKARADEQILNRGLDVIARNTRAQAQLISDLLDISRIVAGKLQLTVEMADLAAIISDAIDVVQPDADEKRVLIERDLEAGGSIAGDRARLQQVVWNLLSNAIKFTPEGGRVIVQLRQLGSDARIVVSDTGIGIGPDSLPYIFDRFQQADRSITRRFGGLGLGLSIVKHLVELHGGTVRAESAGNGQGATFTLRLPSSRLQVPSNDAAAAAGTNAVPPESAVSLDGLRLLLIEDEPDTREFLERLLKTHGAQVVTAASATEALDALSSARPDIVLSDIGLPDLNGYDLLERIRERDADAGGGVIPAIALTAYARSEDRMRALRAGYHAHLAKPIDPTELITMIGSFADLVEARRNR
jgi:PAS domain S-box-containing protein